ncbi:hypothetical protein VF21_09833 [Pseudogymnoascus sp. 05NY08]|nr:hypothetical protein VF21_09833 [Pseudogymnoascus sp. 05NY08]
MEGTICGDIPKHSPLARSSCSIKLAPNVACCSWDVFSVDNWDQVDDNVPVANDIASFIVSSDSALVCADLEDSDGAINAGIIGTDNDNQEDVYTDTYLQEALDFCAKGDGLKKL